MSRRRTVRAINISDRPTPRPKHITLEPEARSLDFKDANGETRLTVAEVPIHSILVIEQR